MLKKLENVPNAWKFLTFILIAMGVWSGFNPDLIKLTFLNAGIFMKKLMPSLLLVLLFMYIFNLLITDKLIKKYFSKKVGITQFLIVGIAGILSTGPVYMWFAFLSNMKDEGFNKGLISIFLYNRAVKLPLLPLMISYFSLKTTIIITTLIIVFSVINALLINLFFKYFEHENSHSL